MRRLVAGASPALLPVAAALAYGSFALQQGRTTQQAFLLTPHALILTFVAVATALHFRGAASMQRPVAVRMPAPRVVLALALLVGLSMRLWLAAAFRGNSDAITFEILAAMIEDGKDIYASERYSYSPLWPYVVVVLRRIALEAGLPVSLMVRGFLTIFDVVNAWLLYRIAEVRLPWAAPWVCAAYLVNPVVTLVVGYHGQIESLAATPLLVAVDRLVRPVRPRLGVIWLLVTLSVVIKQSLVFLGLAVLLAAAPTVVAGLLIVGAVGVFLLTLVPSLLTNADPVIRNVLLYSGVNRTFGTAIVAPPPWALLLFALLVSAIAWVAGRRLRLGAARVTEVVGIAFLALITSVSDQLLIVPYLFWSAMPGMWYLAYTLYATMYLLSSQHYPQLLPPLIWWDSIWIMAVGWLVSLLLPWPWLATEWKAPWVRQ